PLLNDDLSNNQVRAFPAKKQKLDEDYKKQYPNYQDWWAEGGSLEKNDLPGMIRTAMKEAGLKIAEPHYVLGKTITKSGRLEIAHYFLSAAQYLPLAAIGFCLMAWVGLQLRLKKLKKAQKLL
ncbi:MAG: hypothetical protein KDK66_07530, partial [Deltaproteobacteria bacterium]|nr:hypothetical protein [Deltaproteobacteria bacterium]